MTRARLTRRAKIERLGRKAAGCRAPKKCACGFCSPANARVIYDADPSDQYYTPLAIRELAHRVLRGVDFDPATSKRNPLNATKYFTCNALERSWLPQCKGCGFDAPRCRALWPQQRKCCPDCTCDRKWSAWLNPPFGYGIGPWVDKFIELARALPAEEHLGLFPARTGARWYVRLTRACQAWCELHGRLVFEDANGEPVRSKKTGEITPARWGVVLAYFGPDRARARRLMRVAGEVRLGARSRALAIRPIVADPVTVDPRQTSLAFDGAPRLRLLG